MLIYSIFVGSITKLPEHIYTFTLSYFIEKAQEQTFQFKASCTQKERKMAIIFGNFLIE